MPHVPRTEFADVVWPALASGGRANTLAILAQLLQSQWWPAHELRKWQLRQAHELIKFAVRLPHVEAAARSAGWSPDRPLDDQTWQRWPILTRPRAAELSQALFPTQTPKSHGRIVNDATSGSTGTPLRVRRSELFQFMYQAIGLREMLWHDRDVTRKYALIKDTALDARYPRGAQLKNWGGAAGNLFDTGPGLVLDIKTPIDQMAQWLHREAPAYLNSFPSAIDGIIDEFTRRGWPPPPLRGLRTQGEVVTPALRRKVLAAWNLTITDCYSAEEVGYIAHQAPPTPAHLIHAPATMTSDPPPGLPLREAPVPTRAAPAPGADPPLLIAAETTIVEVLDDQGHPCPAGHVGRVIVTPLHNFAMPLLRYELGDYAQVGPPSPCGRGLPVLTRVLGRQRSRLRLPDGSQRFAHNPSDAFAKVAAIRQYQIVQRRPDRLTVNLVATRPLAHDETQLLETALAKSFGHPFPIDWQPVDAIPRTASGKFEDIRSELP